MRAGPTASSDRYAALTAAGPGAWVARQLGLPRPTVLRRHTPGQPLLGGPALVVGVGAAPLVAGVAALLRDAGAAVLDPGAPSPAPSPQLRDGGAGAGDGARLGAVVLDATDVSAVADLEGVRAVLAPAFRRLGPSGRLVVIGLADPDGPGPNDQDPERAAAQHALEGLVRSAGKEARSGATVNLVRVLLDGGPPTAVHSAASTLLFLLSARSAFVSGQVVHVGVPVRPLPDEGPAAVPTAVPAVGPLVGQVAVVTGAARGIGAAIASVLATCGAHVVGVDVPAAADALAGVVNGLDGPGTALAMDITAPDAPTRLASHLVTRHGGADVVVHNAGILRDKLLVNADPAQWGSVLEVNLAAQLRLTRALLAAPGALRPGARVVAVSSTSGIAGNRGQTSYGASKAGVIGMVRALAPVLAERGMSVNAVAPGFIETEMTARMPALPRELGRRASSLAQGGLPVDVAETIAWLAEPASAAVTGQVVRVCGQNLVGA